MAQSQAIHAFYKGFHIKDKLPDESVRLLYLRNIWGLDQTTIGELEGVNQSVISRKLQYAKRNGIPEQEFLRYMYNLLTVQELEKIHYISRSIISDFELLAFVRDLLGFRPTHPLYFLIREKDFRSRRIISLVNMGVQQKRIAQVFNMTQGAISQCVKKGVPERQMRYQFIDRYMSPGKFGLHYHSKHNELKPDFIKAGGTE